MIPCKMTEPDASIISRALFSLANSDCFEMGNHLQNSKKYTIFMGTTDNCEDMATWLPKDRVPVQLQKLQCGKTVLFMNEKFYYANEFCSLPTDFSANKILFGHYTEDLVQGDVKPRLLIYDILDTLQTFQSVSQRYKYLRNAMQHFFQNDLCVLQWVGYKAAAMKLLSNGNMIPHQIDCIVTLQSSPHVLMKVIDKLHIPKENFLFKLSPGSQDEENIIVCDVHAKKKTKR